MSEMEFEQKQVELGRLLNDPGTPIQRDRIWALLEDLMAARPDSRAYASIGGPSRQALSRCRAA